MSPTERILIWLVALIALALGGWATYRSNYNYRAGEELTAWVALEHTYTSHLLADTCHGTNTCTAAPSHVPPPNPPPEW